MHRMANLRKLGKRFVNSLCPYPTESLLWEGSGVSFQNKAFIFVDLSTNAMDVPPSSMGEAPNLTSLLLHDNRIEEIPLGSYKTIEVRAVFFLFCGPFVQLFFYYYCWAFRSILVFTL